jgi:ComF family protein
MKFLYDLWDDFISLLFPRVCYGCGNSLVRNEYLICTECYIKIPRTGYHEIRDNPVEQLFWGRCMIQKAAVFSYYSKGGRMRRIIHNLKYRGIPEIGYEMGRIYASSLKTSGFLDDIDVIVPVPLHPSKKRMRGFNQSESISQGVSDISGIGINTGTLVRISKSDTQTKRSRYDRWANVEGIFTVTDPGALINSHILLVDDVITTGSTIDSCVSALTSIENVRVSVIALAAAVQ